MIQNHEKTRVGFGELAAHLGITSDDVRLLCKLGKIRHRISDTIILIERKDANAYLQSIGQPELPESR